MGNVSYFLKGDIVKTVYRKILFIPFCFFLTLKSFANPIDENIVKLQDKDSSIRLAAIENLRKIEDPRVVEPLIGCLKDENDSVRMSAAMALPSFKDRRAVDPLIVCLKDKEITVRLSAAVSLIMLASEDPRLTDLLIICLKDKDRHMREIAAMGLGRIKNPRATKPLTDCLYDEDRGVRKAAAEALLKLGYKKAEQYWVFVLLTCSVFLIAGVFVLLNVIQRRLRRPGYTSEGDQAVRPPKLDNWLDKQALAYSKWMLWVHLLILQLPGVIVGLLFLIGCANPKGKSVGNRLLAYSGISILIVIVIVALLYFG